MIRFSDKPQEQTFNSNHQSYRFMEYPMQKQRLHLLYPGRPMEEYYHFSGDNIPHENMEGVLNTKAALIRDAKKAKEDLEMISKRLGGEFPVYDHVSIMPEQPVEDMVDFSPVSNAGTRGRSDVTKVLSPNMGEMIPHKIMDPLIENFIFEKKDNSLPVGVGIGLALISVGTIIWIASAKK